MLRQVQQMQDKMSKVQAELETDTVEASAGGPDNLVSITMVKQRGGAETTAA